jgi:hypothetical protein
MSQIVFNHIGGKPPFFDGTNSFDYWKRKMNIYLGSINDRVWEVTKNDFVILDSANPTDNKRANKQCNIMALNTRVKSDKLYMLKDKLSNFKTKDDESILEMFYRLQVIINDLKGLGKNVKDEGFIHKSLMCLPKRFKTLKTIIFRGGLKDISLNEVLRDVMTEDQYNDDDDDDEVVKKEDDDKKKSAALKANSSS